MPIAKKNIPQDFLEQIQNNLTKKAEPETVIERNFIHPAEKKEKHSETPVPATVKVEIPSVKSMTAAEEKKEKYADVINIRLSKGRRNEIKTFCSSCGVTVTQYIESSFEYLSKEVAAGRIVISKGGINRVE